MVFFVQIQTEVLVLGERVRTRLQDIFTSKAVQQVSHEKNPYYFPLYRLVYKDPYNGGL